MTKKDFIKNIKLKQLDQNSKKEHLEAYNYFNNPDERYIKKTLKQIKISDMINTIDEIYE